MPWLAVSVVPGFGFDPLFLMLALLALVAAVLLRDYSAQCLNMQFGYRPTVTRREARSGEIFWFYHRDAVVSGGG